MVAIIAYTLSGMQRLILLLLIFIAQIASADPNFGLGPLGIPNQFPLSAIHQSLTPDSAIIIESGQWEFGANAFWSNTFIRDESYLIDVESVELRPTIRFGVTDGVDIRLTLPVLWRGGGTLDSPIRHWHSALGLPRGHRDSVKNNQFQILGTNSDGTNFSIRDDSTALGNLEIAPRYSIYRDESSVVTLISSISLPSTSSSYAHDSVDLLLGGIGDFKSGAWIWHSGVSGIYFSDALQDNIEYAKFHGEGYIGAEYPLTEKLSVLANVFASSKFIQSINTFPRYAVYFDFGVKAKLGGYVAGFGVRENPGPHDSTTDVSFALTLSTVVGQ